jgi:hypothetical protein
MDVLISFLIIAGLAYLAYRCGIGRGSRQGYAAGRYGRARK